MGSIRSCSSTALSLLLCAVALAMSHTITAQNSPRHSLAPRNAARADIGVGRISCSKTLAAYTEDYANRRADDCQLVHSDGPYGENLFWGYGSDFTVADAVAAWVAEKEYYDYDSNSCSMGEECGHYTQVVWAESVSVGCGSVTCRGRRGVFIICSYDPPVNVVGERPH